MHERNQGKNCDVLYYKGYNPYRFVNAILRFNLK